MLPVSFPSQIVEVGVTEPELLGMVRKRSEGSAAW